MLLHYKAMEESEHRLNHGIGIDSVNTGLILSACRRIYVQPFEYHFFKGPDFFYLFEARIAKVASQIWGYSIRIDLLTVTLNV